MKTKKFLTIFLAITIVTALFSFQIQSSAEEGKFENRHYTIPQTLTPPVIDGVMSENEWTNAYHYFINYDEGYHWYGTLLGGTVTEGIVQDKKDACEGWDIYIQWVAGGDEADPPFRHVPSAQRHLPAGDCHDHHDLLLAHVSWLSN